MLHDAARPPGPARIEVEEVPFGRSAEISAVYVSPDRRGRGLGTAVASAAIGAAGEVDELRVAADDAGRPKQLYSRLGFRPAGTLVELLRQPDAHSTFPR